MSNHNEQVFGELEDCYQAFIPKTKKKMAQKEQSDFQELYQRTVNEIDTLSQNIIDKKFQKLSNSLLQWVTDELTSTTYLVYDLKDMKQTCNISIKFGFLQIDTTNIQTVSSFYDYLIDKRRKDEKLHLDGLEFNLQNDFTVDHSLNFLIYNAEGGLPDLMSFAIDTCNVQFQSMVKAHTTVLLLFNYFTPDELSELKLYLVNDLKLQYPNVIANLIFILPLKQQTVITENYVGKIYSFIDPKKMFVDLLLQMISDPKIPLLSQELYAFWDQDFSYNMISFEQQLFKVKQAYLLMYQSMIPTSEQLKDKKNQVLKDLLLTIQNEPAKNQQHILYLLKRKILSDSIQVFSMYIEKLKLENQLHLQSFKVKLFGLLCSNQQSHWFTLSNDCKLEKAMELFRSQNYKMFLHENVVKYLDDKRYPLLSELQNKKQDRGMQMIQQTFSEKQRFEQYVNQFLNLFIVQILNDIRKSYQQYIFKDINQYFKYVQPDVLEETHNHLIYHCGSNFKQTSENYKKIMSQHQVALSNLVEKQDYIDFQTAIANLKILGLIEDTKRIKPTIERAAYAKQMYINYNDN